MLLLLLTGCTVPRPTAAPPEALPLATPATPPQPLPVSPNIKVTATQLANADPCDLLDTHALSRLGTAKLGLGTSLHSCGAEFDGGIAGANVSLEFETTLSPTYTTSRQTNGVTVYDTPESAFSCARQAVAATDAVIVLNAISAPAGTPLCPIADRAIDAAVAKLVRGGLRPAAYSPDSLVTRDACRMLSRDEVYQVPGIKRGLRDSGYRGRNCTWGEGPVDNINLYLAFEASDKPHAGPESPEIAIGGHNGVITAFGKAKNWQAGCDLKLAYRPLDHPAVHLTVETINIQVRADQPPPASCTLVKRFAAAVLGRLRSR